MDQIIDILGSDVVECTPDSFVLRTPVTVAMTQAHGILHGGVSAFLAEHAGSEIITQNTNVDEVHALGLQLNTTHLLPVQVGDTIKTVATPIRNGGKVRVIRIDQFRESDGALFNTSQITMYMRKVRR